MKDKNTIRIICAAAASVSVFLVTCFLGLLLVKTSLGNTAYAVKMPLLLPLCITAAILTGNIFTFENEPSDDYDENESEEVLTEQTKPESYIPPQLDESIYPELFMQQKKETETVSFERPDIKQIIKDQGSVIEKDLSSTMNEDEPEEDPLSEFTTNEDKENTLYMDLPDELPEDYVAYEYEDEGEDESVDFEGDSYSLRIPKVIIRIAAALLGAVVAVLLPINCSTVYSPDSITVRRPFSERQYPLTNAEYYTIGVTLTGDVSMKLYFEDEREFEMIIPATTFKSQNFKNNYSSGYAYAAFCNRLLERSDIEKRFEDISSLAPSPALSPKDMAYIAEITESDINNN